MKMKIKVYDQGRKQDHQESVKTLYKVLDNIVAKPLDPKVRQLPMANKSVQSKIVEVPHALEFLKLAGFKTDGEFISVAQPDIELINEGLNSINLHVISLGGEVKSSSDFDPTKATKLSTDAYGSKLPSLDKGEEDKYDPTKVSEMIEFIKKQRDAALEGRISDRQIKVINTNNSKTNVK